MRNQFPSRRRRSGFTLVEIMIVVSIIFLLAAIAIPNFMRARKRTQATRILEDLRVLDSALDLYAIETNKMTGFNPNFADLMKYVKAGTPLTYSGDADLFGNSYSTFTVDSIPKVNAATFNSLSDVAPASFWSPYR